MKLKTDLRAGAQCPAQWNNGWVEKSSGGGYYGIVRGQDGLIHYFNMGYTQFYPSNRGLQSGEPVYYAPFPSGNPRAGKVACVQPTYY